ncbi:V-type proton ATPase subunit C of the V1 peripheral membrane domain [Komagataella phaffii CBS 7435]|uniref:V-type proton ATPase subunit C n=2 Tax=Komagataella phaffii TaxID=460519 RepID=C4R034_KOMPG|nr:Subunit C of the eight-subunit V1 peripheral membrane domain of vacuolar H+-ATPase (V-ATPase) [Komagataella phaffii GS115]AOA62779.1 GQ67_00276T0 [Komagataella phaffii]CAH2448641.1 V-type proton ATPase subunit C of the V1 peripheral membrane domain [Komagataella phaffii CBS 7435]AOA67541.1 GQ68_01113T0 [Komagataella phaffii GS115]CAY68858.1 Subunit C of the eight-subunit V1 peripheral membrane domain of vacuolar H+-ATPase (V-ATPase) [Komagataella phaffii GS115]CCA38735.1 V-type proton ATPas
MAEPLGSYLLISLPKTQNLLHDETQDWLETNVNGGKVSVTNVDVPEFKIGTLDTLMQQTEEISKLDNQLNQAVNKVLEIIQTVFDKNPAFVEQAKQVEGRSVIDYLENFKWNTSKYRTDRSIRQLIDTISLDGLNLDNDVKATFQNYNSAKSNLAAAERKRTGDLTVKSLHDIVDETDFVLDSDHLQTILLVIPKNLVQSFLNTYETVVPFVVPRSAKRITADSEFVLYSVILFKKYVPEFLAAARENKWITREFNYDEESIKLLRNEYNDASTQEHSLRNDLIRLVKAAYADIVSSWLHIKILRTFIESVLRYGIPPDFSYFLLKLPHKAIEKGKSQLVEKFGYLGGAAVGVDRRGKIVKDSLHEYASLVDTDYQPFVLYELEIN